MLGNAATRDASIRRLRPRGAAGERPSREVPVRAIGRGGALSTTDGAIVRVLELTPLSALAVTAELGELLLDGIERLLGGLAPGEALQWYAESEPVRGTHLVVRSPPEGGARLARAGAARGSLGAAHRRALERSLARTEQLAAQLDALGLRPRLLDGPGMSRLLLRRLRGIATPGSERRVEVVGALDERAEAQRSIAAAGRLLDLLRGVSIDFRDDRRVLVGAQLEQTIAVGAAADGRERDWLAPLRAVDQRHAQSVHVRAREDGLLELGVYQSFCESGPSPNAVRLATSVDQAVRAASAVAGLRIDRGEFSQRALWPATLPLGIEPRHATHRVDVRVAATALPLFAERCGSPAGVPFGLGVHDHVELLDPWDLSHRHAGVLIAGGSARERAATALSLIARLSARGTAVVALDAEGDLTAACAQLIDGARCTQADEDDAFAEPAPRVVAVDARAAERLLPLAGTAAALLAGAAEPPLEDPSADAPAGAGALVVIGAERLLAEPSAATWLRRTIARARHDGCCVVLTGVEVAPFDAAGVLGVLPVRVLLSHPPRAAAALGERFELTPQEVRAIRRDADDQRTDETPVALWLNGDRGRGLVRLLDLPQAGEQEEPA